MMFIHATLTRLEHELAAEIQAQNLAACDQESCEQPTEPTAFGQTASEQTTSEDNRTAE